MVEGLDGFRTASQRITTWGVDGRRLDYGPALLGAASREASDIRAARRVDAGVRSGRHRRDLQRRTSASTGSASGGARGRGGRAVDAGRLERGGVPRLAAELPG